MSPRREDRELESRRHRSRFDQEPSPKRSRRDGKPETERPSAKGGLDGDEKHRQRLQDAVPLEAPSVQASGAVAQSKDSEKSDVDGQGIKHSESRSPKRSRRDGKPETGRTSAKSNSNHQSRSNGDQMHRRRLQDAVPLEAPAVQASDSVAPSKHSEKSNVDDGHGTKHSDPTDDSRSQYSQHDDRGNAGQAGRGLSRNGASDRGWRRDPKEHQRDRRYSISAGDLPEKGERKSGHGVGNDSWRHDRFSEMERDSRSFPRKRSFRENKGSDESDKANKVGGEDPLKQDSKEQSDRQNGRGRPYAGRPYRSFGKGESWRGSPWLPSGHKYSNQQKGMLKSEGWRSPPRLPSKDNYGNQQEGVLESEGPKPPLWMPWLPSRDRSSSKGSFRPPPTGGSAAKWKHDLYDEVNKSPGPKNEEDVVAKVEALLAS